MESQPQNPDFRINPENFNPCSSYTEIFTCVASISATWSKLNVLGFGLLSKISVVALGSTWMIVGWPTSSFSGGRTLIHTCIVLSLKKNVFRGKI